ncbi:DUF6090 family protein [Winogradskyella immobilis]|uniref:Uncharacterized protein n=1 Tax=Winogradskyella immobilis TaxID=2816852 RepID=A0ABS8ENS3_9FLAO|nr:DUF6090 family protein [Winogradskyella immobilis]MCC1483957.1 hypothetical protein [Winogradskyella immobilis]MCG0016049.1 hypothetical protein [Winogradskyella immobilis]
MSENKTSKYFKYAIGEIILVVIGILIALQINNWNESRRENSEENNIIQNLNDEFSENKKLFDKNMAVTKISKQIGFSIMDLMGKPEEELKTQNIDSLLFTVLETGEYRPSENTINDLIQSGRLRLLKNKKLKILLYNWQSELKDVHVAFERVELKIDNELIPYLSKHYALKDIDKYGALNWKENTNLKIDKYAIFNDIEFENISDDYLYRVVSAENSLKRIGITLDAILEETND